MIPVLVVSYPTCFTQAMFNIAGWSRFGMLFAWSRDQHSIHEASGEELRTVVEFN